MQTVKNFSVLKIATGLLLSMLGMVVLFSCSKEENSSSSVEEAQIASSVSAKASDKNAAIPFEKDVFVPCANGGAGEYVHVTGETKVVYTISWTDHGFMTGYHSTTNKIEGVGLLSGEKFTGSGHTEGQAHGSWSNEQWQSEFIDQLKLNGTATKFVLRHTYRVTVDANGNEKINLNSQDVSCN